MIKGLTYPFAFISDRVSGGVYDTISFPQPTIAGRTDSTQKNKVYFKTKNPLNLSEERVFWGYYYEEILKLQAKEIARNVTLSRHIYNQFDSTLENSINKSLRLAKISDDNVYDIIYFPHFDAYNEGRGNANPILITSGYRVQASIDEYSPTQNKRGDFISLKLKGLELGAQWWLNNTTITVGRQFDDSFDGSYS